MRTRRWSCGGLAPITAVRVLLAAFTSDSQAGNPGKYRGGFWQRNLRAPSPLFVQTYKDLCGTQAGRKGRERKGEWRDVR